MEEDGGGYTARADALTREEPLARKLIRIQVFGPSAPFADWMDWLHIFVESAVSSHPGNRLRTEFKILESLASSHHYDKIGVEGIVGRRRLRFDNGVAEEILVHARDDTSS